MKQALFGGSIAADLMAVLDHNGAAGGDQLIDISGIQRPALRDMRRVLGGPESGQMRLA